MPAIQDDLGVSRTVLVLVTFGGGISGLVAGPLVDWKGSRLLIVGGGLAATLGLLILSAASSLPIMLTGGILAGAGVGLAGGIVIQVLVADWFIQYRGTFLGLALLGSGLGERVSPPLVGFLADEGSWRIAVGVVALGGVGVAVAGFTLIHNYPARGEEDDLSKVRVPGRRSPQLERMIPAGQYIRSPGLWRAFVFLALASAGVFWVRSGLTLTGVVVLQNLTGSPGFIAFLPIGIVVGELVWSMGADFWARRRLLWIGGLGAVVALVALSLFPLLNVIGVGSLLFVVGLFLGGLSALIGLTFVDYMGVRLLGSLSVAFGLLSGVLGLPGSLLVGLFLEKFGGFQWLWLLGAPIIALAVLAVIKAPYPVVELERPAPLP